MVEEKENAESLTYFELLLLLLLMLHFKFPPNKKHLTFIAYLANFVKYFVCFTGARMYMFFFVIKIIVFIISLIVFQMFVY